MLSSRLYPINPDSGAERHALPFQAIFEALPVAFFVILVPLWPPEGGRGYSRPLS